MTKRLADNDAKYVGTFNAGWRNVDVYTSLSLGGGEYYFCPDSKSVSRMYIGIGNKSWQEVVEILLHELIELILSDRNHCYTMDGKMSMDTGARIFIFDHAELSELCAAASTFLLNALPAMSDVYNSRNRKKKKRKGKRA